MTQSACNCPLHPCPTCCPQSTCGTPDRWRRRMEEHPAAVFAALPPHGWDDDGAETCETDAARTYLLGPNSGGDQ